jgi:hypothetical protein
MKKQARLQPLSFFSFKAFADAVRLAFAGFCLDFSGDHHCGGTLGKVDC